MEFDSAILGRFVNFMNNPDEETAAQQFGKGDKYFGVCTLLATLPGLPMIGHGQFEGYAEKYGMEYPRAYWNEVPDEGFIAHHQRAIFPLLKRRHLFAGSDNFTLYDFWDGQGGVNENVYAFSNCAGNERALVLFNNHPDPASGWIKSSVGFAQKNSDGTTTLAQRDLGAALGLENSASKWTIFRENTSNLEFLRASKEVCEQGLFAQLSPYGHQVFLDFREVADESGLYARLAGLLGGAGVPGVERALQEMLLAPLLTPFRALCDADLWEKLLPLPVPDASALDASALTAGAEDALLDGARVQTLAAHAELEVTESEVSSTEMPELTAPQTTIVPAEASAIEVPPEKSATTESATTESATAENAVTVSARDEVAEAVSNAALTELLARFSMWTRAASRFTGAAIDEAEIAARAQQKIEIALELELSTSLERGDRASLLSYALLGDLGILGGAAPENAQRRGAQLIQEWLLGDILGATLEKLGADGDAVSFLEIWLRQLPGDLKPNPDEAAAMPFVTTPFALLSRLLADEEARQILGINTFERVIYFRGDGWEKLKAGLELGAAFDDANWPLEALDVAARNSDFRVVKWMEMARDSV